ncbi:MAG: tRNA (guanine(37)-N1)-methyltransferase Trm5b [Candidatus Methanolliviera sp. GoM_oil]|nr:MAG: tRNA (guanine(37)-N1)-methyltransferase Trm5b [Candidatus Methanolliviera sp. GoM_oil]
MKYLSVKSPIKEAEAIRQKIKAFLRDDLRTDKDVDFVYFPVQESIAEEMKDLWLVKRDFKKREINPVEDIKTSYDVIGDIAILPLDIEDEERALVLLGRKNINVLLKRLSPVEGEHRTRKLKYIGGEKRTETIHKEHGCFYKLDVEKAYFSPRLSTERSRVVKKMEQGDFVIDMFAGIGPFSILAAKKGCRVLSLDNNPYAIRYLRENKSLNRIKNLDIVLGDSGKVLAGGKNVADHVIMNLPFKSYKFLDTALRLSKENGRIYFYSIGREEDLFGEQIREIEERIGKFRLYEKRVVRPYSPYRYHVCIEFGPGEG